ncbi:GerMN domain-containing protein [Paenibacillus solani]|uniref:GerMN domain-containing protein n=1 Tax=Paenibacillus solani TaxID=1705565 RepID=UPI003D2A95F6
MNRKFWSIGLLAAVMLVSAGCGQKPGAAPDNTPEQVTPAPGGQTGQGNEDPTSGAGGASTGTDVTKPETKTESIKSYYTDPDVMELVEGTANISYKEDQDKYEAAYQTLQKSDNQGMIPLWEKIEMKSLKFENGTITIDVHVPDEANLGAGGEAFAIDAIKKTFFQFDEVKSIQLLVDGQQAESLMGHVDLEYPMTR